MIHKLLYKLTGGLPVRLIPINGRPYLERYYLGKLLGVTLYLHRFVSADGERHLHNHPWRWGRSLLLAGRYVEERAVDICPHGGPHGCMTKRWWAPRWNIIDGNTFHRIANARPNTWTLFLHGERVRATDADGATRLKGWGFLNRDGDTTVFMPFGAAPPSMWWLRAPRGRNSQREPE